ncbi:hypothetical protein BU14_0228s0001 [Porphyra umbilicalis]|uniref:Uncharacterized protein n=1 Tax=Porphyra umbilicalis TaxID=2786 RepID=A0A1X6P446_PORUM|nr:hypothetical protein BU14_0228s0001 [Porphyra umbilicalis]|eukprot:OSX75652.1 hypothetical protein BU14_0228s0001 [Porphyra umbilicalis]
MSTPRRAATPAAVPPEQRAASPFTAPTCAVPRTSV